MSQHTLGKNQSAYGHQSHLNRHELGNEAGAHSEWGDMQYKSFRRWVNVALRQRNLQVRKHEEDFVDGIKLYNLLEILSEKKIGGICRAPRLRVQCVNNLWITFRFMEKENVGVRYVGPEDVADGNLKLILGLIWMLILRYQIQKLKLEANDAGSKKSPSSWIIDWINERLKQSPRDIAPISKLSSGLRDGVVLNALINTQQPAFVSDDEIRAMNPSNGLPNVSQAHSLLTDKFGVPPLLDASDIHNGADEKSLVTYMAGVIEAFKKAPPKPDDKKVIAPSVSDLDGLLSGLDELSANQGSYGQPDEFDSLLSSIETPTQAAGMAASDLLHQRVAPDDLHEFSNALAGLNEPSSRHHNQALFVSGPGASKEHTGEVDLESVLDDLDRRAARPPPSHVASRKELNSFVQGVGPRSAPPRSNTQAELDSLLGEIEKPTARAAESKTPPATQVPAARSGAQAELDSLLGDLDKPKQKPASASAVAPRQHPTVARSGTQAELDSLLGDLESRTHKHPEPKAEAVPKSNAPVKADPSLDSLLSTLDQKAASSVSSPPSEKSLDTQRELDSLLGDLEKKQQPIEKKNPDAQSSVCTSKKPTPAADSGEDGDEDDAPAPRKSKSSKSKSRSGRKPSSSSKSKSKSKSGHKSRKPREERDASPRTASDDTTDEVYTLIDTLETGPGGQLLFLIGPNRSQASPEMVSKLVGDVVGIVTRAMTYIDNPKVRDAVAQRSQAFMSAGFGWSDAYRGRVANPEQLDLATDTLLDRYQALVDALSKVATFLRNQRTVSEEPTPQAQQRVSSIPKVPALDTPSNNSDTTQSLSSSQGASTPTPRAQSMSQSLTSITDLLRRPDLIRQNYAAVKEALLNILRLAKETESTIDEKRHPVEKQNVRRAAVLFGNKLRDFFAAVQDPHQDLTYLLREVLLLLKELRNCVAAADQATALKCVTCGLSINGSYINFRDLPHHPHCFSCATCKTPLENYYDVGGVAYCEAHNPQLLSSERRVCAACGDRIVGACMNALNKYWHNRCLRCCECGVVLGQEIYVIGERTFCAACSSR
eukprot:CAMPEP_0174229304 /NCGR_PEP_ID=MMETSP0417-20130205/312_1 /TAXON_ID=242541 /ORGANISM="Mayorella sp, Strain BSH-02190019" /LENGTH=1052 /DNA_ID=CAMNT_0015306835 /DNA_START=84 /DNA_END=3238 /DNA_ORIENTATION=+